MKKSLMNIIGLILLVLSGTADGAQELTPEELLTIIQRMMDSLPAGRWVARGVLKTDRTKSQNDGEGVLVERITSYVEPDRVLQEFHVVSQTGKMEVPPQARKAIDTARGKDVWVSQADTAKCLYILNRTDLDAWNGTTILISSKPIDTADQSVPKAESIRSPEGGVPQNRSGEP